MYIAKIEAVGCPDGNTVLGVGGNVNRLVSGRNRVVRFDGVRLFVPAASHVNVFDMQGRLVVSARNVADSVRLNSLAKGVYVVHVQNGNQKIAHRVNVK